MNTKTSTMRKATDGSRTEAGNEKKKTGILIRFEESEDKMLRDYEERGLNMSELVRRCVKKSLRDVVEDLKKDLP